MATPMQLVESVSSALGVDLSTVITHDRNLVAAGLRTKGGRGSSAARMTAQDAANLLIAVAGADQVGKSVQAVETFSALRSKLGKPDFPAHGLRRDHTFGEALTAIIQDFVDDSFRGADDLSVDVTLTQPRLAAEIRVAIGSEGVTVPYGPPAQRGRDPPSTGDLVTTTRFSRVTLQPVGEILRL